MSNYIKEASLWGNAMYNTFVNIDVLELLYKKRNYNSITILNYLYSIKDPKMQKLACDIFQMMDKEEYDKTCEFHYVDEFNYSYSAFEGRPRLIAQFRQKYTYKGFIRDMKVKIVGAINKLIFPRILLSDLINQPGVRKLAKCFVYDHDMLCLNDLMIKVNESSAGECEKSLIERGYKIIESIDSGGFGYVFKVGSMDNKKFYAAKFQIFTEESVIEAFDNELEILTELNKLNKGVSVHLYDHWKCNLGDKKIPVGVLILELYNGDFNHLIEKNKVTSENINSILCLIKKFHKMGFVHLDLKPNNIFYKENPWGLSFVLGDFGFSKNVKGESKIVQKAYCVIDWAYLITVINTKYNVNTFNFRPLYKMITDRVYGALYEYVIIILIHLSDEVKKEMNKINTSHLIPANISKDGTFMMIDVINNEYSLLSTRFYMAWKDLKKKHIVNIEMQRVNIDNNDVQIGSILNALEHEFNFNEEKLKKLENFVYGRLIREHTKETGEVNLNNIKNYPYKVLNDELIKEYFKGIKIHL